MKKLTNKKGFTLMEMIIVVAIIVVLAAISIPTLTTNLDKAKKATDESNLQNAKAAAVQYAYEHGSEITNQAQYYYDVENNTLVKLADSSKAGYGECSNHYDSSTKKGNYIIVTFTVDANTQDITPSAAWDNSTTSCN